MARLNSPDGGKLGDVQYLPDEDRAKVALQVDMFIDILAKRYGLEPRDVVDAVRWVQDHKQFVSKMKHGGMMTLLGITVTSVVLAAWEGAKAYVKVGVVK